ncbi:DUF389 domain-containing protein [Agromyces marinus]|uniref:DUF389 domain-containing protein n=1 Tax=Agromyces marinus TaxID=1389020 RepID=A0ABM8GX83_9MICO|nr:DUF389 domain-containing protein [Agromyces marinus]UIP58615.1 hypothetical protein DSM26151_14940 [Agromyces marinus]BDZ53102.1 hypothetical protein GCM10025870_01750 [Agromyces marinus]
MEPDDATEVVDPDANIRLRGQFRAAVAAVSNAVGLRGLACIVGGTVVLLLPDATTTLVVGTLIAFLAGSGLLDLVYTASGRRWFGRRINRVLAGLRGLAVLGLAVAAGLLAYAGSGELTLTLATGLIGIYVGIRGIVAIVSAVLRRREHDPLPAIAGGALAVVAGVLAFAVPASIASTVIVTAAIAALIVGLILISWCLRRSAHAARDARAADGAGGPVRTGLDPATASISAVLWDWIEGSDIGRKVRAEQANGLYFERPQRLTKLGTWWVMLVLSVAIATFAVLADSTAVVIGAMLVAPLMTPILGLSAALVNGWGRRALESGVLVAAGAAVSITLAMGIAAWSPVAVSFATNSQIVSRVSPNTIDLLIALAAGAAGAFATVNARVASGIAGVAIAVALVPPLAVVGVSLDAGRFDEAGGASLLFLTNFVAIVLAAAGTFVLTGFARPYALRNRPRQILQTVAPFVALAGIILLPLTLTSEGLLLAETRERDAQQTVEDWLGEDSDFTVTSVKVDGTEVRVTITGPGDPPRPSVLHEALQDELEDQVRLALTVVPVEVVVIPSGG